MANIKVLQGADTLREMYPKVNENFQNLNIESADQQSQITTNNQNRINDLNIHKNSKDHPAENITYSGKINKNNVKDALDDTKDRIDNIVTSSGTSNTEIVDARQSTVKSKTFANVKARLEESESEVKDLITHVKHAQKNTTTLTPLEQIKSVTDSYASPADFKLGGNTLYNTVVNGDFRNGTTGWEPFDSNISENNKVLRVTGNGVSRFVSTRTILNIPYKTGDKVFFKVRARVTNTEAQSINIRLVSASSTLTSIASLNNPIQNIYYDIVGILTFGSQTGTIRLRLDHVYPDASTANGKVMEVEGDWTKGGGVFAIPITGTPYENMTAEQINGLIGNEYFEGLKSSNKMEILTRGRNLFDGVLERGGYSATTGLPTPSDNLRNKNRIHLKAGTYRISQLPSTGDKWGIRYNKAGNFLNSFYIGGTGASFTITMAQDGYLNFYVIGAHSLEQNIMLNEGSALPYEPYQGSKAKIQCTDETKFTLAGLNSGIKNEILMSDGKWRAVKRVERYVLQSGDITGVIAGTNVNRFRVGGLLVPTQNIIVESYQFKTYADDVLNLGTYNFSASGANFEIRLVLPQSTTLEQAKSALAGTVIYYELATPITIEEKDFKANGIQVEGQLATNTGFTEFVVDSYDIFSDLEAEYSVNVAKAVEKLKNGQLTETEFRQKQNLINLEFDARLSLLEI